MSLAIVRLLLAGVLSQLSWGIRLADDSGDNHTKLSAAHAAAALEAAHAQPANATEALHEKSMPALLETAVVNLQSSIWQMDSSKSAAWNALVAGNTLLVIVVVGGLLWVLRKLSTQLGDQKDAMLLWLFSAGPFILVWYCSFSVGHTFFQHQAADVKLNPVVPTIVIYLMKLVIALIMYRSADGTFSDLVKLLSENKGVCVWYLIPAACLASYDALSFMTLQRLSPAQYQILLHLRTVFIAFFWQVVMSKRLSLTQWTLLLTCIYAAMLTERDALQVMMAAGVSAGAGPYMTLFIQYFMSVTGNLSNEKFLKQYSLCVNAQNIVLYTLGGILLSVYLLVASVARGHSLVTVQDLPKVMVPSMALSIVTLALMGVSTGFLLKYMGNIWKELAGMAVTFTTASIDWFVLRSKRAESIDVQAVVLVSLSLCIFALMDRVDWSKGSDATAAEKLKEG
eukprot:TRINITY_DN24574_c0_g1_i1.p1 TRINITY_DN24574_c0_g1~~TRINITY_DN24574_c0_g1_i1.p1  ORF type:complete len:481 (-),score=115.65 TRINITY_DN24574_c0_g1_i1:224-1585(-)